ncbi:TRAP transporter substrate-binding protein [Marasmitruncus massiliensis]|jgi:tripartite ATP-independent transporter DctP family solute receptor|uniref:TRAP transporter substrate-binding protein n=1 Tax=Marasmitruncus massiliensis TaxID=1944642 RepID=UPI000C7E5EF2|nr:TRAP transporter substrate-binding protein [Marasmitruncus massiliensis]MBE6906891.1 TRAP transporter substrate-binding protein [Oscillospiraceae bacterium]
MKKHVSVFAMMIALSMLATGCGGSAASTAPAVSSAPASSSANAESAASSADSKAAPQVVLIGAHVNTVDSSYQAGMEAMKEKLEELSGGTMTMEIHGNGELGGNEAELVEKMATGTVDIIVSAPNFVATSGVPEADLFSIPFLYSSLDHWKKVVTGEVGQTISDKIDQAGAFHSLGYWSCGTRQYFGVKPITQAADLKGVKIRVQDSEAVRNVWSALGANPTTLAYNELYSGLQNNVIDAAENDLGNILLQKFYEAGPYVSLTNHDIATRIYLMGANNYNTLTDEQRAWVDEAAKYSCEQEWAFDEKLNQDALEKIKENGGIVNELDTSELINLCADARAKAAEKLGVSDLLDKINAAA